LSQAEEEQAGDIGYKVAMNYILCSHRPKVSYFTSAYNTKSGIYHAYHSLLTQTNDDWEWIIVNDSPNCKETSRALEILKSSYHRIKVHEFKKKSGGVI
jgi:glycosyltransferase involved in cell wall biosynthesis